LTLPEPPPVTGKILHSQFWQEQGMKRSFADWKHGIITWAMLTCGGFSEYNLAMTGRTGKQKKNYALTCEYIDVILGFIFPSCSFLLPEFTSKYILIF